MDSKPLPPSDSTSPDQTDPSPSTHLPQLSQVEMDEMIERWREKYADRQLKLEKEQKERRQERAERRAKEGKENVDSDTEEDEETHDLTEEEQKAFNEKKMKERETKVLENAKIKFTYQKLVEGLKTNKFKRVVVVTGAGISVAAGIPDFRSPKTGLYANLQQYNLPRPESMFDIEYFKDKPEAFYHLAKEFLDLQKYMPTPVHHFIKLLDDKKVLQINMTQNIDNLEEKTGIDMTKVAQAHGANVGAKCSKCKQPQDRAKLDEHIKNQTIMRCDLDYTWKSDTIYDKDEKGFPKFDKDGKYIILEEKTNTEPCLSPIKPNIVFFGEPMDPTFHQGVELIRNKPMFHLSLTGEPPAPLYEHGGCDLMIVIGTALAVFPFNSVIYEANKTCPKVLINLENLEHNHFDFDDLLEHPERLLLAGRAQDTIKQLCRDLGWFDELQGLMQECERKYGPPVKKVEETKKAQMQVPAQKQQAKVAKKLVPSPRKQAKVVPKKNTGLKK